MSGTQTTDGGDLEYFGVKLKVRNAHLASLLNSDVSGEVRVVGRRARETVAAAVDPCSEDEVAQRVLAADDSVTLRVDEHEER